MYEISEQERRSGRISPDTLESIIRDVQREGYAVVRNVVPRETCSFLNESILEDVARVRAFGRVTQHEMNTALGHLQLGIRRYAPYVKPELVANPLVECVVAGVLGRGAWLGFYSGNINCPGSASQPLHFDRPFSWKTPADASRDGENWPPPTTTLSCSVALQDITEANGATEIYPGTHRETEVAQWSSNRIADRPDLIRKWAPSLRMEIPAGGVCFRDPRMWHRGVPNQATTARAMIAVTYHAGRCKHWRGLYLRNLEPEIVNRCEEDPAVRVMDDGSLADGRLFFQSDAREVFDDSPNLYGIYRNSRFVDEPERVNHFLDPHTVGGARVVRGDVSPGEG